MKSHQNQGLQNTREAILRLKKPSLRKEPHTKGSHRPA